MIMPGPINVAPHTAIILRVHVRIAKATPSSMPASRFGWDRWCSGLLPASIILMGAWSAATATYFAFRDDVLTRLIARQAEMQYAYEDRIAELRARVDRTTSKQLLDQEQYDQKLNQIMKRQTLLESRATALNAMPDASADGIHRQASCPSLAAERQPVSDPKAVTHQ